MKIEGTYSIACPRELLFPLFTDPAVLARAVPGCRKLERESDDLFRASLEAGVGAIKGTYDGTVKVSERAPPERLVLAVEGQGKTGFVKGLARLSLAETQENGKPATNLAWEADVQVGGTIASVGQRMISGASKVMAGQFFAALEAEARAAAAGAAPPRQGPITNLFRLLRHLLGRLFRSG